MAMECPNHEGAFDCTPFCNICEGEQEYFVLPSYSMLNRISPKILKEEDKDKIRKKAIW
jgi:hypothetical protein